MKPNAVASSSGRRRKVEGRNNCPIPSVLVGQYNNSARVIVLRDSGIGESPERQESRGPLELEERVSLPGTRKVPRQLLTRLLLLPPQRLPLEPKQNLIPELKLNPNPDPDLEMPKLNQRTSRRTPPIFCVLGVDRLLEIRCCIPPSR